MTEPHNPPQDDASPHPVRHRRTAILVLTASLLVVIGAFFYYVNRPKDYIVIPTVYNHRYLFCKRPYGMNIYINKKGEIKLKTIEQPHQLEAKLWLFIVENNLGKHYPTFLPSPRYYHLIDRYGRIQLVGDIYTHDELHKLVKVFVARSGPNFIVFADENGRSEEITCVLDMLRDAGATYVELAAQTTDHQLVYIHLDIDFPESKINPLNIYID